ncbi:type I-B CRISPR-associated protein Cas8b/Csh1 [Desulfurobacterium sp.]
MIEGILQIGKVIKEGKKISEISADIPKRKKDIKYKIGKINFLLEENKIKVDLTEEYSLGKEDKYKFIQLKLTGAQNQFLATFTDLKRFAGDLDKKSGKGKKHTLWLSIQDEILQLFKKVEDEYAKEEMEKFLKNLNRIENEFYKDCLINFSKIESFEGKNISDFKKSIKKSLGRNEDIIFWTILINNEKVVDKPFYELLIKKKIIDDKKKAGNVVCFLCNKHTDEYFDDFARLPIKFFINDKVGFSQKLSDRWEGNFVLCEDCYLSLFAGEKFILNNFISRIGNISFLVIPEVPDSLPVKQEKLKEWAEYIKVFYNPFQFFDRDKLKEKLDEYREYEIIKYFLMNYIFFEQNNQQFKIFTLVRDIPKGRLEFLQNILESYKINVFNKFPLLKEFVLESFGDILWIIPLRISKNDNKIVETSKITNLFAIILEGSSLNREFLIHEFWIGAKAKYFKNLSYHNVTNSDNTEFEMINYILKTHQLLFLLKYAKIINGGHNMKIEGISEEFNEYIEECGFDEKQTALFLLGTLIADVGSKQAKYGSKPSSFFEEEKEKNCSKQAKYGSKPVLNKINFQGISLGRLQILFNEIYEKLEQEKLLYPQEEIIYAKAKELLDRNKKNWNLKPYENVYYLLSGYAFKTKLNIEKSKEKKEENSNV